MSETYWKLYPRGDKMIPASVPRKVWVDHWKRTFPHESQVPDPPELCRNYWGRFQGDHEKELKIRLGSMHSRFWDVYLSKFPRGHDNVRSKQHDFSVPMHEAAVQ
jgi:hypothetical protein